MGAALGGSCGARAKEVCPSVKQLKFRADESALPSGGVGLHVCHQSPEGFFFLPLAATHNSSYAFQMIGPKCNQLQEAQAA